MPTLNHSSAYRLIGVAGSVLILSSAVSIAAVLAWSLISNDSHSAVSSVAPSPLVVTKVYTTTLAPLISHPLEENLEMMALLDLHRQARNRIVTQDYKTVDRFEKVPSRVFQKAVWNLAD